jgi:hypothetical protein
MAKKLRISAAPKCSCNYRAFCARTRAASTNQFFLFSPFGAVLFLYPCAFGGYLGPAEGLQSMRQWSIKPMLTVIESPLFTKLWSEYWSEEERAEFAVFIANAPKVGDVIPGSGGCRKIRWARAGSGKRGGVTFPRTC